MDEESAWNLLMNARCRLYNLEPWYGTMAALMDWTMDKECKTMGVRMKSGGRVECRWNPDFVNHVGATSRDGIIPLMKVFKHEIEHIVRMHITRYGARDPRLSNFAADACVNGPESHPHIDGLPMIPVLDKDGNKVEESSPYFFPEGKADLPVNSTMEEVYNWLDKNRDKVFVSCPGDSELASGGGQLKPKPGQEIFDGTTVDDHSVWEKSELSEDETRQVVKDMVDQASKKAGNTPGHLKGAIESLQEPKVNWRYLTKQWCGRVLGGKRITFARRNRRVDQFGMPGRSSHASIHLMLCIDVSSSVATAKKMLEQFFSEIEQMSHQFKITLVLWDAKIQYCERYHRGDWHKIQCKGGQGTNPVFLFEYLKDNRMIGKPIIVLTDGEFSAWPEPVTESPVLWCMPGKVVAPWGQTVNIEM